MSALIVYVMWLVAGIVVGAIGWGVFCAFHVPAIQREAIADSDEQPSSWWDL